MELDDIFRASAINTKKPVLTYCSNGLSANIVDMALRIVAAKNSVVYEGVWSK